MASRELPTRSLDPGYPDPARFVDDEVVFREFCCPGCGVRLASETGYPGEAPFHELRLD
jgi:acetone carboxylase gamma subunit